MGVGTGQHQETWEGPEAGPPGNASFSSSGREKGVWLPQVGASGLWKEGQPLTACPYPLPHHRQGTGEMTHLKTAPRTTPPPFKELLQGQMK